MHRSMKHKQNENIVNQNEKESPINIDVQNLLQVSFGVRNHENRGQSITESFVTHQLCTPDCLSKWCHDNVEHNHDDHEECHVTNRVQNTHDDNIQSLNVSESTNHFEKNKDKTDGFHHAKVSKIPCQEIS